MTEQTKRFIELADVLSLRFTCKHCASELLISAEREIDSREDRGKLAQCPVCGRGWTVIEGNSVESRIADFIAAFRSLRAALSSKPGSFPAGFRLTLEVVAHKEPA
jgi:transcription elongation factor Elf1